MANFKNVLLIEDDPITVLVCERIAKLAGFAEEFHSAANGLEAIEYIQKKGADGQCLPELIFLDINMPVMNGWEFLENFDIVRPLFSKVPFIYILSSTVDPEDQRKALSYPLVKNFISKPLTKNHLVEIAEELQVS
ncbi:response regulator [Foetidibacter luteolus]|uniref:response regulator n=1 Tax=Foetidibacter luteolus TaxID=2608880 RepID=UPI00129BE8DC|nr:response regulator [Foetidibacter luteolus]